MKYWPSYQAGTRKNSINWVRESKMSEAECARLLYEEVHKLFHDCTVFHGQYGILMHHYRKLIHETIAA